MDFVVSGVAWFEFRRANARTCLCETRDVVAYLHTLASDRRSRWNAIQNDAWLRTRSREQANYLSEVDVALQTSKRVGVKGIEICWLGALSDTYLCRQMHLLSVCRLLLNKYPKLMLF